jgi:hypothetical protein
MVAVISDCDADEPAVAFPARRGYSRHLMVSNLPLRVIDRPSGFFVF